MPEPDDQQLLAEFITANSEAAFNALVSRHVNLVYSAALRFAGNSQAAEEISQAVFIILARKAGSLRRGTVLSGWLYQTARLLAANYVKREIRRQRREQEAYMQSTMTEPDSTTWEEIAPLLDEAMGKLGEIDRNAVVLRFFENKTSREVAAALKLTEAAAHKRVSRALEKLRHFFTKRGIVFTTAIIAGAVSANSVHAAPVGLASTLSTVALAKGVAASASTLTLVKGALKIMAWTKAKTAAVVGIGILLAAGTTTTITIKEIQEHRTYPWQVQNANSDVLRRVPPQVRIVGAKYPGTLGGGVVFMGDGRGGGQILGISQSAETIVANAYNWSSSRTAYPDDVKLPTGDYDYIANLHSGNEQALQQEVKKVFGVVGQFETENTNVLLLEIQNPDAPGLKPADPRRLKRNEGTSSSRSGPDYYSCRNESLSALSEYLEYHFKIPVIDRTESVSRFDIDLKWKENDYQHPDLDDLRQPMLNQLGLELVSTNMPIKMLIVEKVK